MNGRSQRSGRQMALWTRSRSTCLRATSKGSTAVIPLASHANVPAVHAAARRPASACDVTSSRTPPSTGLIPLVRKISPDGSSPGWARPRPWSAGAEGAGNHTRCRRGSRRGARSGTERRSWNLPISKTGHGPEVRGPYSLDGANPTLLTTRLADQAALRRRWPGASGGGARPHALPRSARPRRRTSPAGTARS